MEGIWVPTNYYLQIKPQIHQILEASEAMMDMQFDPSQSTRTFVLSSVMTEISVVISGVNSRTRANGVLSGANA